LAEKGKKEKLMRRLIKKFVGYLKQLFDDEMKTLDAFYQQFA